MRPVRAVIDELLASAEALTASSVAARAGVSRQAAHKQLKALVDDGTLTVEGKARATRYHPRRDLAPEAAVVSGLWAKVHELGEALGASIVNPPQLTFHAQARLGRAQTVEVASAGSLYRLSARLLLGEVDCDELTLDFNGVVDLGDEFVEEVFEAWASAHRLTTLKIVNLDPRLLKRLPAATGEPAGVWKADAASR